MEIQDLLTQLTSGDDDHAEAAAQELAKMGEAALPMLDELLQSNDPDHRWWAVRTLAAIRQVSVAPRLAQALRDPDPEVRQCAVLALRQHPNFAVVPELVALLESKEKMLARLAGDALVAIGGPAVSDLMETLENGPPGAQIEAARALALIGDTRAVPAMFAAWEHGSTMVRHWVEQGFENMGIGMVFFQPE